VLGNCTSGNCSIVLDFLCEIWAKCGVVTNVWNVFALNWNIYTAAGVNGPPPLNATRL
jgi:hypothetical protein